MLAEGAEINAFPNIEPYVGSGVTLFADLLFIVRIDPYTIDGRYII